MQRFKNQTTLIEAIRQGEENAFVYLIETYSKLLFGYAISLTNDEAMAQDIIQNVFIKTWVNRTEINIAKSFQNYLLKSVYNEFINQYKKHKSQLLIEQKYHASLELVTNQFEETNINELISKITDEIQKLPPKCKDVFLMSRKEGLTNIEIANYLNISKKSVEAHITKAFSLLKNRISNKLDKNS